MPQTPPFFSVVICTLNEQDYLPLLLKDLTKQTFSDFEVIHIDANSTDKTVSRAAKYQKTLRLQSKVVSKRNVSFQRNTGATLAQGDWILFCDADNRLPPHFLEGIKYQIAKDHTFDVFTTWAAPSKETPAYQAIIRAANLSFEMAQYLGKPSIYGAMIGVKRKLIKKFSFNENLAAIEDSLYVQDICHQGYKYKILRDPTFYLSLRRLEKEGALKMAGTAAMMQIKALQGKEAIIKPSKLEYPMLGGAYYEKVESLTFLSHLKDYILVASNKQLAKARQLLTDFNELS